MPRTSRNESKSKIYHIMSRALNKQILFDTEQDFLYFLKILQDVKKTDKFSLYAYCLMSNHYHLIIRERNISISKIMNRRMAEQDMYLMIDFIVKALKILSI